MQLSSSDLQWGKLIIASIENGNLTHPFMKDDSTEYIMRYNETIYPMEKLSFLYSRTENKFARKWNQMIKIWIGLKCDHAFESFLQDSKKTQ